MSKTRLILALIVLMVPATAAFGGQLMTMETVATTPTLEKCDTLHHEQTCNRYHVAGTGSEPNQVAAGTQLILEDPTGAPATYVVQNLRMVYTLADGSQVVEPVSSFTTDGSFELPITLTGTNGLPSQVLDSRLKLDVLPK